MTELPWNRCNRVKAVCKAYTVTTHELRGESTREAYSGYGRYADEGSGWPCFHAIFSFCTSHSRQEIEIDYDYQIYQLENHKNRYNNVWILERHEFVKIIKMMKTLINFSYSLTKEDDGYIHFRAHVAGSCKTQKAFMMLSRMLFEYPHNTAAIDAIKMKKELDVVDDINFNKISFLNLYLICLVSTYGYSCDESLVDGCVFSPLTVKSVKNFISPHCGIKISNITQYPRAARYAQRRQVHARYLEEYRDPEKFTQRVNIYIENIKIYNEYLRTLGAHWG